MIRCTARLTQSFIMPCTGQVHSIFTRLANLSFVVNGRPRLLTLIAPGEHKLPDSICVPERVIQSLCPELPVILEAGVLWIGEQQCLILERDQTWDGFLFQQNGFPAAAAFLQATSELKSGFNSMPKHIRRQAEDMLLKQNAQHWIGLGPGLTPSFDDACIGVMAIYRAAGIPPPFLLRDYSATTDISARYLQLSSEGYFGELILNVIYAIYRSPGLLSDSLSALIDLGATSGKDILHGMHLAF